MAGLELELELGWTCLGSESEKAELPELERDPRRRKVDSYATPRLLPSQLCECNLPHTSPRLPLCVHLVFRTTERSTPVAAARAGGSRGSLGAVQ